ncbi:hypothetical protein C1645_779529 [Glomus cerebriforme]|uniref:Uncharacterized protein n=1 Tax=Glomus cerebriforme TaxID=658196 RepID=A0A397SK52_9GLOM|nr:hypothetical protein C1645_779529 [Glomus cerebriforme]
MRFFLILIICLWGYFLEFCGEQPDYSPELRYLMSFGSFVVALVIGALAQASLVHMFAYVQGYFLLKKQGIPLQAVMSGEQTPARVLLACMTILRQIRLGYKDDKKQRYRYGNFFQIILYASTLIVYVLSVSIGAYAASKLGTPFVYYSAPVKWVQAPTEGIQASLNNAFMPEHLIQGVDLIQFTSLADWVDKTRARNNEVAFLPTTWTTLSKATQDGNLKDKDGLIRWNLEADLSNINMQYLTANCNADPNPSCDNNDQILRGTTVRTMAGKENKTISWQICDLPRDQDPVQLNCNITLKQGLFPHVIIGFPNNAPRDEHLAEVLLRKNELTELTGLTDDLFEAMENAFSRTDYQPDVISKNVVEQLVSGWDCNGNITCAQTNGESATVRYTGALLEAASFMYPTDNSINLDDLIDNSKSTGILTASHKVCIGGNDPLASIALMISIPLLMLIIEILPLLTSNKVWWLASDIGYKHIALLRSASDCKIDLERTTRLGEIPCQTIIWFNAEEDHLGLSSNHQEPSEKV